jgi:positive regulator of sigma E activity
VRSPSFSVGSVLSILSLILIIIPYLSGKNVNFSEISQNIGFNLLGAVAAFVAFEIIFRKLKEAEEQQGVELDFFKKTEFIKMVFQTNFTYKFLQK